MKATSDLLMAFGTTSPMAPSGGLAKTRAMTRAMIEDQWRWSRVSSFSFFAGGG